MGFCFLRSWMGLLFFCSALFQAYDGTVQWRAANDVFVSSLAVLTASLLVCSLLHQAVLRVLDSRLGFLAGPTLAAVGVAVLWPSLAGGAHLGAVSLAISAVLTGTGSCLVLLDVGRTYASTTRRVCLFEALLGTALGSLLPLAAMALPVSICCALAICLMYAAAIGAHQANLHSKGEPRGTRALGEVLPAITLGRLVIGAFILGFATGLIRYLYSPQADSPSSNQQAVWFFLLSAVVCLALMLPAARQRRCSMSPYYKLVIVLCTAGFAIVPIFEINSALPHLLFTVGYALFEVVAWVIMAEIAHRFQYTSVQVFGIGRILVVEIGVIAGVVLFPSLGVQEVEPRLLVTIAALCVISITAVSQYVLRAQDIRQLESSATEREDEGERQRDGGRQQAETAEDRRGTQDGCAGSPSSANCGSNAGRPEDGRPERVPLLMRCRIVGAYYGLTEREIDVMHLFATGRTAARVREELVISAGTVNTHALHIYQKMDVHSRQELIEKVADADLDAMVR